MQIPFLAWLLQGIPESIAVAAFVFSMDLGVFSWNKVLKVGFIQAIVIYVVRLLPFTPGVHVLVLITSLALVSMFVGRFDFKKAASYSAIIISFVVIFEVVFFGLLSGYISFKDMNENVWMRILFTYPQVIAVFLLAVLVRKQGLNRKFDKIFRSPEI